MTLSDAQALALLQAAEAASLHAYAPYSDFPVGAALLAKSGDILTGVNVENVSYGLTLCAERSAVVSAIAQGARDFQGLAVFARRRPHGAVTPCGACRQVLAEFLAPDCPIISRDEATGALRRWTMADLLPDAFAGRGLLPG